MNCYHCERPAHGICRFCGRAVCKDHAKSMPFILTAFGSGDAIKVLAVDDVLFCGLCKPKEEPVDMSDKDPK
jgi:hypothetical protein